MPTDPDARVWAEQKGRIMHVVVPHETRGTLHFLRHLFEMLLAMMLGMFAGGALFVATTGISAQDAIENHSVAGGA